MRTKNLFLKKFKNKKGSAIVEMAMVMVIYIWFIGFQISSFQIMHNKIMLNLSAYEAARASIVIDENGNYDTATGVANGETMLSNAIGLSNTSIDVKSSGDYMTGVASGQTDLMFPIVDFHNGGITNKLDLTSEVSMRKERP
ncbi:MAG: TadE/TadG family type IV pilus assembly protein [Candidatus Woesearchaeota archaeon]